MNIDPSKYSNDLKNEFHSETSIFNLLIERFNSKSKIGDLDIFNIFMNEANYASSTSKLNNYAYELYNNLRRYFKGGVFELYKYKETQWGAPEVKLTENDVPSSDILKLKRKSVIYRGLSHEEYSNGDYGQSWTLEYDTAKRFALDTYSDKPAGIVVETIIERDKIIYYSQSDKEFEVIVKYKCINNANIVQT